MNAIYPFDADNSVGPYLPLVTPSHFDVNGAIVLKNGNVVKDPSGYNTTWPIGLTTSDAFDFCFNVKTLRFDIGFTYVVLDDSANEFEDTLSTNGMIRRFFVSPGTMFKHRFQSVSSSGSTTTNDITIDFTQSFYDYRSFQTTPKNYFWFPYIKFEVAGSNAYLASGSNGDGFMIFDLGLVPSISIDAFVADPVNFTLEPGSTAVFNSSISVTERYDEITFSPTSINRGGQVTINIPAHNKSFDDLGSRDGFATVKSVSFGDSAPVTTFQLTKNANGVFDTIVVTVPNDATTGSIKFKSVANTINPTNTTDYYNTGSDLVIT